MSQGSNVRFLSRTKYCLFSVGACFLFLNLVFEVLDTSIHPPQTSFNPLSGTPVVSRISRPVTVLMMQGAVLSQLGLIAIWAVYGIAHVSSRVGSAVLLTMLVWLTILLGDHLVPEWCTAWQELGWGAFVLRSFPTIPLGNAVSIGLQVVFEFALLIGGAWVYRRLTKQLLYFRDTPQPELLPLQFSTKGLLVGISYVGIAIVLLPQLIEFDLHVRQSSLTIGSMAVFAAPLVLLPCVRLTLDQNRSLVGPVVLLTAGIFLGILTTLGIQARIRWLVPFHTLGVFVVLTMLVLLLVRKLGFRLRPADRAHL